MPVRYEIGVPDGLRADAARLYDQAFGAKLALAIPDTAARVGLLEATLRPAFAVAALDDGALVGIAGFQTSEGSLTSGITTGGLFRRLGVWGGLRAVAVFALYERSPEAGELVMDGIAVADGQRGKGIGTGLLERLAAHATAEGFRTLRLDVIDTNDAARRLYARRGFEAVRTERFEVLRGLLGFGASTTMVRAVTPPAAE